MKRWMTLVAPLVASLAFVACGGGGGNKTDTPTARPSTTASPPAKTASASATGVPSSSAATITPATSAATRPPATLPAPANTAAPAVSSGRTYNATQARVLLDEASTTPKDLTGVWNLQTDTVTDNAAAAATDPQGGASFERCGRLLGRTAVNQPKDIVSAFLGGESVSVFSTLTVYATEAGAIDCSAEAAVRLQQPGELARAFGSVFVDPNAVQVVPVQYEQVGDASFAATLTGKVNAAGTVVDITILLVGFRKGNVSGAVGTAHSAGDIPTSELTPYLTQVLQRIGANQ